MTTELMRHTTYAREFRGYSRPKPKLIHHVHVRRVPPVDPGATLSKNWVSESKATNGAFDMEMGLRCRAMSAPAQPRWAPLKLLPPDWSTSKWSSTYRTGSGSFSRPFHSSSQKDLANAPVRSVSSQSQSKCPYSKKDDHFTPASTMSEIGSWDLRAVEASNKLCQRNKMRDRDLSESWFNHPDNPPPPVGSTYGEMTDPLLVDKSIFDVDVRKLSTDEQMRVSRIQWLMQYEKSKYAFQKTKSRGTCMTDSWLGKYWPRLHPPPAPTIPNALRTQPLANHVLASPRNIAKKRAAPTFFIKRTALAQSRAKAGKMQVGALRSSTSKAAPIGSSSCEPNPSSAPLTTTTRTLQHNVEDFGHAVQTIPLVNLVAEPSAMCSTSGGATGKLFNAGTHRAPCRHHRAQRCTAENC